MLKAEVYDLISAWFKCGIVGIRNGGGKRKRRHAFNSCWCLLLCRRLCRPRHWRTYVSRCCRLGTHNTSDSKKWKESREFVVYLLAQQACKLWPTEEIINVKAYSCLSLGLSGYHHCRRQRQHCRIRECCHWCHIPDAFIIVVVVLSSNRRMCIGRRTQQLAK